MRQEAAHNVDGCCDKRLLQQPRLCCALLPNIRIATPGRVGHIYRPSDDRGRYDYLSQTTVLWGLEGKLWHSAICSCVRVNLLTCVATQTTSLIPSVAVCGVEKCRPRLAREDGNWRLGRRADSCRLDAMSLQRDGHNVKTIRLVVRLRLSPRLEESHNVAGFNNRFSSVFCCDWVNPSVWLLNTASLWCCVLFRKSKTHYNAFQFWWIHVSFCFFYIDIVARSLSLEVNSNSLATTLFNNTGLCRCVGSFVGYLQEIHFHCTHVTLFFCILLDWPNSNSRFAMQLHKCYSNHNKSCRKHRCFSPRPPRCPLSSRDIYLFTYLFLPTPGRRPRNIRSDDASNETVKYRWYTGRHWHPLRCALQRSPAFMEFGLWRFVRILYSTSTVASSKWVITILDI